MKTRKALQSDRDQLIKLNIEFNKYTQAHLSPALAKMRASKDIQKKAEDNIDKDLSEANYFTYVAEKNGKLCGYICGEIIEKKHNVYDKEGYIKNWFVEEEFQSKGIGRQLFNILINEFKKQDCTHLALDTNVENKKAIEIYEKNGFKKRLFVFFKPLKDLN